MAGVGGWASLMPGGLEEFGQGRWASGMVRSVARHLLPEDSAWDIQNGLLDDDGNVYMRGPTSRVTSNQLSAGSPMAGLWEASFTVGRRTVGLVAAGGARIGVLDSAGTVWSTLTTGTGTNGGLMSQLGDYAFISVGTAVFIYAGSRKSASYAAGTSRTVTNGSALVTGVATAFLANVDVGMIVYDGIGNYLGIVKSVDSDLQVTMQEPWRGPTQSTGINFMPVLSMTTLLAQTVVAAAVIGGRLFYVDGRKVRMSPTIDPNTGAPRISPLTVAAYSDYHEFPADVISLAVLRDRLFVFTKAGIYVVSNLALEQVDAFGNPQHRVERTSGDVILRAASALATWRDAMIVCAQDGVYVMDAAGGLELISRSITPFWLALGAGASYVVGQVATYRDHVFIPLYQTTNPWSGIVLVARLDRRIKTASGKSAPWTQLTGEAGSLQTLCVQDPYGAARLVGGGYDSPGTPTSYLLNLTGLFSTGPLSTAGSAVDANGTSYGLTLETREYVLDAGGVASVKDVALEYEGAPAGGSIGVAVAVSQRATAGADPTFTALAGWTNAGNFASQAPRVAAVNRVARRVAFRFTTTGSMAGIRIRGVRGRARLRGRRR